MAGALGLGTLALGWRERLDISHFVHWAQDTARGKFQIGIMMCAGRDDIVVYDYDKCVVILMERDGWSDEEAEEWMEVNVVSAWMGDGTPGFVRSQ